MSQEPKIFNNVPEITCKVISQKGFCDSHHKVGQTFEVVNGIPTGLCPDAMHSIFPALYGLTHGASYPWEPDKNIARIACPDQENPVVIELRRITKDPKVNEV